MKYLNTVVTFQEVPDEISLCVNITECPIKCDGCHSPELQQNIGKELTFNTLGKLIKSNKGITCVCFMGGDPVWKVQDFAIFVHQLGLKFCWYTGLEFDPNNKFYFYDDFDYLKTGRYNKHLGPLTSPRTNQRFYKKVGKHFEDITSVFWKNK